MPNHYPPYPSFHGEWMAALALALLGIGVTIRSHSRAAEIFRASESLIEKLAFPRAAWAWASLPLIPLAQFCMGMLAFRADLGFALAYALAGAMSIYVGYMWATQVGRTAVLGYVFSTIVAGGLVANGFALAQWLQLPTAGWWAMELIDTRPYGNLAQSNHFGLLMTLGVIGAAALFELRVVRSVRVLALLVGFLGWGILMSQSRASALAFTLVVACWILTRKRAPTRFLWPWVLGAFVLWVLVYLCFHQIQDSMLHFESSGRDRLDGGVRPAMWHHFVTAILAHPWAGYGFGQGVAAMAEVATQLPPSATRSTVYAHNFVLDLAVWCGIPLALLLVGGLAYWILGWLRTSVALEWRQHRHLVLAVWIALVTQSLLEYPYAYAYFLIPCAILAGIIMSPGEAPATRPVVPARSAWIFGVVALLVLVAITWDYKHLEDDFRQARFARARYQNLPDHNYLEKPLVLDLLATINATALSEPRPGMSFAQLEKVRRVARRVQNPALQMDYAKALALNCRSADAQHELDILRSIYAPEVFTAIDQEWRAWLQENMVRIPKP